MLLWGQPVLGVVALRMVLCCLVGVLGSVYQLGSLCRWRSLTLWLLLHWDANACVVRGRSAFLFFDVVCVLVGSMVVLKCVGVWK